jgi:small subunit ribosomal protein S13
MPIIAGVNIPDNKRVAIALTKLYGIGPANAARIIREVGLPETKRARELNEEDLARIRSAIDRAGILIEGDLRREVQMNIRRLIEIQAYRGLRHRRSLPTRGQRTRTNARTRRGNKRLTVAGKRKTPTKA